MIEGCHIEKLQEQILALKVEQPPGSIHLKIHHKTEGIKDDEPDALANACFVAKGNSDYFESSFVSSAPKSKKKNDIVSKGIKTNNDFLEMLRKNSVSGPTYF